MSLRNKSKVSKNSDSTREIEDTASAIWTEKKLNNTEDSLDREPWSVMMPPPNVTGNLHMGHALNMTLQDVLTRFWRMNEKDVLWQPGTDHAGIATQMLVERQILSEKKTTRAKLGREKFIEKVWDWKEKSGGQILEQLQRLGASADWNRQRFTLDEELSKAVKEAFIKLSSEGLIYRDKRLVNWDTKLQTAISDLEVIQKEQKGYYWHFKYPVLGTKKFIVVATTRPETMLGDTAVAVHPEDDRYKNLIGKKVMLPIADREITILSDTYADPNKGSGAVKITPAHDFNDFLVGKRHKLQAINIMNPDGTLNNLVPDNFRGISMQLAREKIIADMQKLGLLKKIEETVHIVPYGDRSETIVEPYLTDQWFLDVKKLAGPAIEAVENGETKFVPKSWENTFFDWMNNIEPWCISRQLWWGHRIPAWHSNNGDVFVAKNEIDANEQAFKKYGKKATLTQDPDVLDTWFSSGMWPFSTLGWPNKTRYLKKYYPGAVLVTGFDIIFFWVARMMMLGIHFMKKSPFKDVYVHALIRDSKGNKMSKSKGNVVDPLVLMDKYGVDSVRFTLVALATQGRDIKLAEDRIVGYRNFITKIFNASRFLNINKCKYNEEFNLSKLKKPVNRWIVSLLYEMSAKVSKDIKAYRFNDAANKAYQFVWHNYCDWYLEIVKPILTDEDNQDNNEIRNVSSYVFSKILSILHPIIPFSTEYLYTITHQYGGVLALESWPNAKNDGILLGNNNDEINWVIKFISEIRYIRFILNIPYKILININFNNLDIVYEQYITDNEEILKRIARIESFSANVSTIENSAQILVDKATFLIPLKGIIDVEEELNRLNKDLSKLKNDISKIVDKLKNKHFIEKAPKEVVSEQMNKKLELENSIDRINLAINKFNT